MARQRADTGDLSAAVEACARLLAASPSADVLYLLGVVRQAQGDAVEARRCFEKLLYLEPRHRDGLWRMVWLLEQARDTRAAEQYRRRAVSADAEVKP